MPKADGSIVFAVSADYSKATEELNELEKKIKEIEDEVAKKQTERNAIKEQLEQAEAAAETARQKIKLMNEELAQSRTASNAAWARGDSGAQLEEAQRQKEISAEIERQNSLMEEEAQRAVKLSAEIEKVDKSLSGPLGKLDRMRSRAGELTEQINYSESAAGRMAAATAEANKRMDKFANRVKGLARRVFVFTLISSALRSIKDWLGSVIKSNDQASAAMARLKGALLTLAQPLVNVVIPAFTVFAELLTNVVSVAADLLSKIFGTTASESAKAAEALYKQTSALNETGSAAKKAGKSLAGFDEINQIGGGSQAESEESTIAPDFSGTVSTGISEVAQLFTGMALFALGAILTFTGVGILPGLSMMAAGAAIVYNAAATDTGLAAKLTEAGLNEVIVKVGVGLLGIGAVLAFTGVALGLGIALMLSGAAMLAAPVALNWGVLASFVEEHLTEILVAVGASLLVLGAIFAFTGVNIPLGIGLMLAGAAGLGSAVALNWDAIRAYIESHLTEILLIVSGALLVLGAIFTFTGANIALGIGMLLAGAAGLGSAVAINWNAIVSALQGPIGLVSVLVGTALLVLGVILLFTGVGIPIGLGLILAGVVGLAAPVAANWDFLLEKIKGAWEAVKGFWNEHIAPVFTAKWWGDLAKKAINGFLSILESGINKALNGAASLVNGIIGLINKIPGIDIAPVSWGNVKLPRLATGAVIPPNREFLAVLGDQKSGTNIEAPLETIVQAFRQALAEQGGGSSGRPIYLMLDRRELGRAVVEVGDQERTRVGISLA